MCLIILSRDQLKAVSVYLCLYRCFYVIYRHLSSRNTEKFGSRIESVPVMPRRIAINCSRSRQDARNNRNTKPPKKTSRPMPGNDSNAPGKKRIPLIQIASIRFCHPLTALLLLPILLWFSKNLLCDRRTDLIHLRHALPFIARPVPVSLSPARRRFYILLRLFCRSRCALRMGSMLLNLK